MGNALPQAGGTDAHQRGEIMYASRANRWPPLVKAARKPTASRTPARPGARVVAHAEWKRGMVECHCARAAAACVHRPSEPWSRPSNRDPEDCRRTDHAPESATLIAV